MQTTHTTHSLTCLTLILLGTLWLAACHDPMPAEALYLERSGQRWGEPTTTAEPNTNSINPKSPTNAPEAQQAPIAQPEATTGSPKIKARAPVAAVADGRERVRASEPSSQGKPQAMSTKKPGRPALVGTINIQDASAAQLQMLPGIGPALAQRIVTYRAKRPFRRTYHLRRVRGIGAKTFAKLKPYLSLEGDSTLRPGYSSSSSPSAL